MLVFGYALHTYGNDIGLYNAALGWKIAFSIPYAMSVLIYIIQLEDQCDNNCILMHRMQCDRSCPGYNTYEEKNWYLLHMWFYDISIIGVIFILRMVMILYFHMRNLKFSDLDLEGGERKPLLSDDDGDGEGDAVDT